jgi:hypothetical protein
MTAQKTYNSRQKSRARLILPACMILKFAIMTMFFASTQLWFIIAWAVLLIGVFGLVVAILAHGEKSATLAKLAAWIDRGEAVKILDMHGKLIYAVVYPLNESCQLWAGPVFWTCNVGEVVLLPNGYVAKDCDSSYLHVWQPLDLEWATEMSLTYPEFPDFSEWARLSRHKQWELRTKHGERSSPM